ncbi:MAG TPA: sugar transferase [Streptosporangiaceae bacterium]|nr:sugar transferase [Streptosporangiaceae bacterium]
MTLAIIEGLVLSLAVAGSAFAWGQRLFVDWLDVAAMLGQAGAVSLCCIVAFYYNDLYDLRVVRSFSLFTTRLLQSFGVALLLLALFYALVPDAGMTERAFVSGLLVAAGLLVPLRAIGYLVMRRRAFADRVLVLGAGPLARQVIHEIESRPNFRYAVVGVVDDGSAAEPGDLPYPVLGPLERLDKIIDDVKPDRLIVALTERRGRMPLTQLLECGGRGILVEDGLRTYEYFTGKLPIESLTPSFLIFSGAFRKSRLQLALRRATSLVAAAVGLLLTAPLVAVIALAIALDSRGPILFIDQRAGRGGRPFNLVKFRTMHPLPPGQSMPAAIWDRDDTRRITRVGWVIRRLRLDELPQFWNILTGDMDLVGPRPEILANVQAMSEQIPYYALRHSVRPGLTGWAQTRFGYSVSLEQVTEKIRYDLFYIKHMSFWLDLRILVDTVKIVLFGRGAK